MSKKIGIYAIKDLLADEVGPIFEAVNDSVAWRKYHHIIKGSEYPTDFALLRFAWILIEGEYQVIPDIKFIDDADVVKSMELTEADK